MRDRTTTRCAVTGCPALARSRGWCNAHYLRWRNTGDPGPADIDDQMGPPPPRGLDKVLRGRPACSVDTAHLFDPPLDGESRSDRVRRQWAAAELCAGCPVRARCAVLLPQLVGTAPAGGQGVWAGHVVGASGPRPVQDPAARRCSRCRLVLPADAFSPRLSACRACCNAAARARRAA